MTAVTGGKRWKYEKAGPTPGRVCKDCGSATRPAPYPGPRCATDHNARKRNARIAARGRRLQTVYGITQEFYDRLRAFQGGRCAICRRATGASKNLAVDHDHRAPCGHTGAKACSECVRGLLCSTCNDILAHFRDDPEAGIRLYEYLRLTPKVRMLNGVSSWGV